MKVQFLHLLPSPNSLGSNVTLGPRVECLDVAVGAKAAAAIIGLPAVGYSEKSGPLAPLSSYIALPGYALDISRGNGRAVASAVTVEPLTTDRITFGSDFTASFPSIRAAADAAHMLAVTTGALVLVWSHGALYFECFGHGIRGESVPYDLYFSGYIS